MDRKERIYFDILCRLQDICDGLGIEMWLAGHAALAAFRGKYPDGEDVCVYAEAKHAVRLAQALGAVIDDSFTAESMLNSERYPRFEIRACDPRTVDCDTSEFFKIHNNCMHVTIRFLQEPSDQKSFKARAARKLYRQLGGSSAVYKHLSRALSGRSPVVTDGVGYRFRREIFDEKQTLVLNGREFYIPRDTDSYFEAQFGPGWEYVDTPDFVSDDKHFMNPDISWKELNSQISSEDVVSYEKLLREYRSASSSVRKLGKEVEHVYDVTACCCDKISFYKEFAGRTEDLRQMLKDGDFVNLGQGLDQYLRGLKKAFDRGLDLYINDELTAASDALLRHRGQTTFADAVMELLPKQREPLTLRDHLGQPTEYIADLSLPKKAAEGTSQNGLSEAQKRLLALMKRVDKFLREHDIEYFLFGGSLLGAIRHDGFIPWDDDIDIVMTRDNYYRLVELSDDLPWDDISFDCYEKDPGFGRPFGMFTLLTDTRFVKTRVFMGGAGMGTGIDVFVMDNVPEADLDEYLKNSLLYQEIQTDSFINNAGIFEYREEYFACKEREAASGKRAETLRLRAELEKYGSEKPGDLRVVRLWFRKPRIYKPGMMANPVMHKFEDTEFPVPERAAECLNMQYGADWNVIPEEGDRDEHAFRIDFDVCAANYFHLIDSYIDWDHIYDVLSSRKTERIRLLGMTQELDSFRKNLASACKSYGK